MQWRIPQYYNRKLQPFDLLIPRFPNIANISTCLSCTCISTLVMLRSFVLEGFVLIVRRSLIFEGFCFLSTFVEASFYLFLIFPTSLGFALYRIVLVLCSSLASVEYTFYLFLNLLLYKRTATYMYYYLSVLTCQPPILATFSCNLNIIDKVIYR